VILENKLGITDQAALARAEEKISKHKARQLFDSGDISAPLPGWRLSMPICLTTFTPLPGNSAR